MEDVQRRVLSRAVALAVLFGVAFWFTPAESVTRFHFTNDTTTPGVAPSPANTWHDTTQLERRRLWLTAADTNVNGQTVNLTPAVTNRREIDRQYVSTALATGTVFTAGSTTVTMQLAAREVSQNNNVTQGIVAVQIWNSTATTLRATLLSVVNHGTTTELQTTSVGRNKSFTTGTVTVENGYTTVAGDILAVEIGYSTGSQTGTSPQAISRWGGANTDCGLNESDSNCSGWIEFSNTFSLAATPTPTTTPTSTVTPTPTSTPQATPIVPLGAMSEVVQVDTTETARWGAVGTTAPVVERSIKPVWTGNTTSLKFTPGSTTSFLRDDHGNAQINLSCHINVTNFPEGMADFRVASFENSSGTKAGILLAHRLNATQYQLRAKYLSDARYTCNGTTRQDTPCTPTVSTTCTAENETIYRDTICPENHECESRCSEETFAAGILTIGDWGSFTLQQENHTSRADVAVRLWAGPGGTSPAVLARGGGFRVMGTCAGTTKCVGGTNAGATCTVDSQCPDGGYCEVGRSCSINADCQSDNCATTNKINPDRIILGSDTTVTGGPGTFYLDGCVWYVGTTAMSNYVVETLSPASSSVTGNWVSLGSDHSCGTGANLFNCWLDQATAFPHDGDNATMRNLNIAQPTAIVGWSALSTPTNPMPSPTPKFVALEALAKQIDTTGMVLRLDFEAGTDYTTKTNQFPDPRATTQAGWQLAFTDKGNSAGYYNAPVSITSNYTIMGSLNALSTLIYRNDSTSNEARLTTGLTSVWRETASPNLITTVMDRGKCSGGSNAGASCTASSVCAGGGTCSRDGEITVCVAGDSILDNDVVRALVTDKLAGVQIDNLLFCSKGGQTSRDAMHSFNDILDGKTSQWMKCQYATRGFTGRPCDVVFVQFGANDFHTYTNLRNLTTVEGGDARVGWCEMADSGDAQEGQPCACASLPYLDHDPTYALLPNGASYCVTKGNIFGQICDAATDCTCDTNADCTFNGTAATCTSNVCGVLTGIEQDAYGNIAGCRANRGGSEGRGNWCTAGCTDSPDCSGGVCIAPPTMPMIEAQYQTMLDTAAAKTASAPVVVMVNSPSPAHGLACWYAMKHQMQGLGQWLREKSQADTSIRFLDMDDYFRRNCNGFLCQSSFDGIHVTSLGESIMAQAFYDCLANVGGANDGVCTGGICTGGKLTDGCSSNADCDLHRCNFTTP